ncbi:Acetylornithine deacetylase-like protein [Leptomonas pyrrhocoris]|uniref:Acetylornithine deacetylase-like protein n=1 Tax=Leptomonas pyrrhocoris TaxID=157538 RepID=A0A0N0DWE9_LEPPY|nr:Acetylornithine deacetylase-like protein [Leptomonas pyrrhocoris]XP_015660132.1 Acetylornithine deacetylase-like protein [Leptomonas pyrrhocoris]KPA81692.1 Acetylornithine deacetylase-like protein [Leptomonas pyrrhocoris]KPA81693.1 Acetylornithine deacetylase-like protein [Leptomonas pyrrhocoris]|eukprot:XP_015660131.1 Acetylornithine deacetylase-like protein [Leptomonas pyrrhocoris]
MGCTGIPSLIDYMKKNNVKADVCLVGDGNYALRTGNKGHSQWRCTVKGKAIHSSMALMGTSCNAIEYAAMIITTVREMAKELKAHDARDHHYRCPYSAMSTNLIQGGNAVNTVPAEFVFEFSLRVWNSKVLGRMDARIRQYINEVVVPEMRKEYAEAAVELDTYNTCPGFNADESAPFTKLARRVMGTDQIVKSDGTTEAGYFQERLGVPTVIIGAGTARAHEANEYTSVENLMNSHRVTLQLVTLCTETDNPFESHL